MTLSATFIETPILNESGATESVNIKHYKLPDIQYSTIETSGGENVYFYGASKGSAVVDYFSGEKYRKLFTLLIKAVNNRTIERDYFKKYSEMAAGEISEDEFESLLNEYESEYMVSSDGIPNDEELKMALHLSQYIKDVKTSEDLASLFSFDVLSIENRLNK